jgi:alpha-beta hydrolase superfamily lysophospholipase
MNHAAYRLLRCPKQLTIIPGATHLFEEPGTLEQVAEQALRWFQQHFALKGKD